MAKRIRTIIVSIVLVSFIASSVQMPALAQIDPMPFMPAPGVMVNLSPEYTPAYLKGIVIHPENALKFDFIIYKGDKPLSDSQKRAEYTKLTKYFLASLAIPDDDQWVNLSPYEKDRIIKDDFGKTEMGRDLLAQDYMLKQITASLIYPEDNLGKEFWNRVYAQAQKQYGTTNIPVNTFNKVWILPDDALIYEKSNENKSGLDKQGTGNITAYILKNHLRVMLEEDYLSLQKHSGINSVILSAAKDLNKINSIRDSSATPQNDGHSLASKIIRQIVLPELQREVNEDKNFAALRQVYSGMLLATWFKRTLKQSLLGQIYANKAKVRGLEYTSSNVKRPYGGDVEGSLSNVIARSEATKQSQQNLSPDQIYQQYLRAYKKGVFNFIKEDVDKYTNETMPRKYFSGGISDYAQAAIELGRDPAQTIHVLDSSQRATVEGEEVRDEVAGFAMVENRRRSEFSEAVQARREKIFELLENAHRHNEKLTLPQLTKLLNDLPGYGNVPKYIVRNDVTYVERLKNHVAYARRVNGEAGPNGAINAVPERQTRRSEFFKTVQARRDKIFELLENARRHNEELNIPQLTRLFNELPGHGRVAEYTVRNDITNVERLKNHIAYAGRPGKNDAAMTEVRKTVGPYRAINAVRERRTRIFEVSEAVQARREKIFEILEDARRHNEKLSIPELTMFLNDLPGYGNVPQHTVRNDITSVERLRTHVAYAKRPGENDAAMTDRTIANTGKYLPGHNEQTSLAAVDKLNKIAQKRFDQFIENIAVEKIDSRIISLMRHPVIERLLKQYFIGHIDGNFLKERTIQEGKRIFLMDFSKSQSLAIVLTAAKRVHDSIDAAMAEEFPGPIHPYEWGLRAVEHFYPRARQLASVQRYLLDRGALDTAAKDLFELPGKKYPALVNAKITLISAWLGMRYFNPYYFPRYFLPFHEDLQKRYAAHQSVESLKKEIVHSITFLGLKFCFSLPGQMIEDFLNAKKVPYETTRNLLIRRYFRDVAPEKKAIRTLSQLIDIWEHLDELEDEAMTGVDGNSSTGSMDRAMAKKFDNVQRKKRGNPKRGAFAKLKYRTPEELHERLESFKMAFFKKIDASNYDESDSVDDRIEAYKEFVSKLGIPFKEEKINVWSLKSIIAFNKQKGGVFIDAIRGKGPTPFSNLYDLAGSFFMLLFQVSSPYTNLRWDKSKNMNVKISMKDQFYPSIIIPMIISFLIFKSIGFFIIYFFLSLFIKLVIEMVSGAEGHELTHIVQYNVCSQIVKDLGLYYSAPLLITLVDLERRLIYVTKSPPSRSELKEIVEDVTGQVEKILQRDLQTLKSGAKGDGAQLASQLKPTDAAMIESLKKISPDGQYTAELAPAAHGRHTIVVKKGEQVIFDDIDFIHDFEFTPDSKRLIIRVEMNIDLEESIGEAFLDLNDPEAELQPMPRNGEDAAMKADQKISEVPAIFKNSYTMIRTRSELDEYIEVPWLEAARIFYDKNILTISSTANAKDVGRVGAMTLDYDSLSEKNKAVARQYGQLSVSQRGRHRVTILLAINQETTIGEFSQQAVAIANAFEKQKLTWARTFTLEELQEGFGPNTTIEMLSEMYYYDPQSKLFYDSEEIFRKARDSAQFSDLGGIDMNAANLAMTIKRDGNGVPLPLSQQDLAQLSNIEGLDPIILSIKPASQTALFSDLVAHP